MSDVMWKTPTVALTSYLTTTLDGLANGAIDIGAAIDNESNLDLYMDLELMLASLDLSAQVNPCAHIYMLESIDGGTDYETGTDAATTEATYPAQDKVIAAMMLRKYSGAEAKVAVKSMIPIPPGKWKLGLLNKTGAAFAASGNTLSYRTYRLKNV